MSVVIIISGPGARQSISDLETISVGASEGWRAEAEALLQKFQADASALADRKY